VESGGAGSSYTIIGTATQTHLRHQPLTSTVIDALELRSGIEDALSTLEPPLGSQRLRSTPTPHH
jgi:hypothetical protein